MCQHQSNFVVLRTSRSLHQGFKIEMKSIEGSYLDLHWHLINQQVDHHDAPTMIMRLVVSFFLSFPDWLIVRKTLVPFRSYRLYRPSIVAISDVSE